PKRGRRRKWLGRDIVAAVARRWWFRCGVALAGLLALFCLGHREKVGKKNLFSPLCPMLHRGTRRRFLGLLSCFPPAGSQELPLKKELDFETPIMSLAFLATDRIVQRVVAQRWLHQFLKTAFGVDRRLGGVQVR